MDDGLVARLEEWLERIQEGDRPLPWVVHSGCSYRRIASEPTPESGFRSFPDGNVLHAYNQRSDGHPDLSMGEKQLSALVEIVNNLPAILSALRAQSDAEVERMRGALIDLTEAARSACNASQHPPLTEALAEADYLIAALGEHRKDGV